MNKSSSSQTVEKVEVNELEDGEISDTDSLPPANSAISQECEPTSSVPHAQDSAIVDVPETDTCQESGDAYYDVHQLPVDGEAVQRKWLSVMADIEAERFGGLPAPYAQSAQDSCRRIDVVQTTSDDAWCEHCAVFYDRCTEKQHKLLYHDVKTVVYRCQQCGADHASYSLLLQHIDQRHTDTGRPLRPKKVDVSVPCAGIAVLPSCSHCGYGSLIPYANSYHSCQQLPVMVNGLLLVEKQRVCSHHADEAGGSGELCHRCVSYFNPPLLHVNYLDGKFIIDVDKITQHEKLSRDSNDLDDENEVMKVSTSTDSTAATTSTTNGIQGRSTLSAERLSLEHGAANDDTADVTEIEDGVNDLEAVNVTEEINDVRVDAVKQQAKYKCGDCGLQYHVKTDYWRHRKEEHVIKDCAYRCRVCGYDSAGWSELKRHYAQRHPRAKRLDIKQHYVVAKPFIKVPHCDTCNYASCIAHALKYHECDTEPVYDWQQHKLRIRRADVCSHGDEPGDVCDDCVAALQPTERRVKYDCSRHEFVITVREKLVSAADESDDLASSDNGASDYDVVDTSDESDENDMIRDMRARFRQQASTRTDGARPLMECRFCGKSKSRRTLLMHIKKFHLTKFLVFRCPLCGFDAPTYQDVRGHWRRRHELFTPLPKPDIECVSEPYESVPSCHTCGYQTLIPHALKLHSCERLPTLRDDAVLIERTVKCEHAQDVKYSYGVGAPARICINCLHHFIDDPDLVKFENNVFKVRFSQTLTKDDPQFQAQKALAAKEKTQRVGMGPGLSVSRKRLVDHSCTDLVSGIELRERYFCLVHAKEFQSAEALVQHNYSMHGRRHITEAYRCFICAYDGGKFSATRRHVLRYHKDECVDNTLFVVKVTVTGYPKIPICKTCGYASMDSEIFKEHGCFSRRRKDHASGTSGRHQCTHCGTLFMTSTLLQAHVDNAHTRWMRIYRCFACGYDSDKFHVVRDHINDNHDHDKGTVVEEHCSVAVKAFSTIPICKKCGFTSLLDAVFKRHRCYVWPETFFLHNVPSRDKPGPHVVPLWRTGSAEETLDSHDSDSELPPIPLSWKPIVCDTKPKPKSTNAAAKTQKPAQKPVQRSQKPQHEHASRQRDDGKTVSSRQRDEGKTVSSRQRDEGKTVSSSRRPSDDRHKRRASTELLQSEPVRRPRIAVASPVSATAADSPPPPPPPSQWRASDSVGHVPPPPPVDVAPYEHDVQSPTTPVSSNTPVPPSVIPLVSEEDVVMAEQRQRMRVDTADDVQPTAYDDAVDSSSPPSSAHTLKETISNFYSYIVKAKPVMYDPPPLPSQAPADDVETAVGMPTHDNAAETSSPSNSASSSASSTPQSYSGGVATSLGSTQCSHCFAVLSSVEAKAEHVFDQHELKTTVFRCPVCFLDFTRYKRFHSHFRRRHRTAMRQVDASEDAVRIDVDAFTYVPLCSRGCGFASINANVMMYHQCEQAPRY